MIATNGPGVKQARPNPQGKAALPHLNELQQWRGAEAATSSPQRLLVDYLCGLLVLSADFSFKPVAGAVYHLYFREQRWTLSLIAPDEWRPSRAPDYVATCELQQDATWRIRPATNLTDKPAILQALSAFEVAFRERVNTAGRLVDDLPHYERSLPYYRRVLASGLASSLTHSLRTLGLEEDSGTQVLSSLSGAPALSFTTGL